MGLKTNNHSVFELHYHLVLVVKYRRRVLGDIISDRLREIFENVAENYHIIVEEWKHDINHVHVLFQAHPKIPLEGNVLEQIFLSAGYRRCNHGWHQAVH